MFNTCAACGHYRVDKIIDLDSTAPDMAVATCPVCGHEHPFRRLPLMLVGGASGTGKSAACSQLTGHLDAVVLLESDILWRPEFNSPETHYRDFFETWLRMAKNIGQSGRPVVLFGAGFAVADNIEPCVERRYFSTVHYLALVCDDTLLAERLRARPSWRESGDAGFIAGQQAFNHWLRDQEEPSPPITRLDTSNASVPEAASAVALWITQATRDTADRSM